MPSVSFDGQSLAIDGRRVWLVSGAIHYPRVPRALWRDRLRAARQAGLNCVETYVFWNAHEPRPGQFDFRGNLDLRAFVELAGREGLFCILRPGPYVCSEWDMGGLPAWLLRQPDMKLRESHPAFMEACARYFGAVMDQVRDLQVTAPARAGVDTQGLGGGGGPILLVQVENEWFCANAGEAQAYHGELARYLRENGCEVPLVNCNNLWQRVEGTIDCWNGNGHLARNLRQLQVVQPHAPRFNTEFWPGWFDQWDGPHNRDNTPDLVAYRLASVLAAGGQYNLYMFHGGTNFGFWGGRTVGSEACFMTTSYDYDSPVFEAGGRGRKYRVVKRISTFASQFGRVFAALEPAQHHAITALDEKGHPPAVIQQSGSQGKVVFLLRSPADKTRRTTLLLPNGVELPVALGEAPAKWLLLDAALNGEATLDYSNLSPWAFLDHRLLVLFGAAGTEGIVRINGAETRLTVPAGQEPLIQAHEGLTLAVLNEEQVDAAIVTRHALLVGAEGLDEQDRPLPLAGFRTVWTVWPDGRVQRQRPRPVHPARPPRLGHWQLADTRLWLSGQADAFRPIDGPASHEQLGCDYGYGWYRLRLKHAVRGLLLAPQSADRLHVFAGGKRAALLGVGPGAQFDPVRMRLARDNVVLVDNLGRFNYGWHVGERKGIWGHFHLVRPVRLGKPRIVPGFTPDPFVLRKFWNHLRQGERVPNESLVWKVRAPARAGSAVILDLHDAAMRAMVLVNGKPLEMYERSQRARYLRLVLEVGRELAPGGNELALALWSKAPRGRALAELLRGVRLYQSLQAVTARAEWAFAPWALPDGAAFGRLRRRRGEPAWYRCQFRVSGTPAPLWFEPRGLTKGQLYLNGINIGRYFVADPRGRKVPPQERYYLPEPWLKTDGPNELVVFDEHGGDPRRSRLVYDPMGPYGDHP